MTTSRADKTSKQVQKRIANHSFGNEGGEEYEGSEFGGFDDYFRRKRIKLQNLDATLWAASADKPQIFNGVVAHVNGYTQPSLSDLHVMIVQHGGGFLQYLDGKMMATHIIASALTPKKAHEFRNYRIVKPDWVVDSIAVGKLLSWNTYRVINPAKSHTVLGFGSGNGSLSTLPRLSKNVYREQSDRSWYASNLHSMLTNRTSSQMFQMSDMSPNVSLTADPTIDQANVDNMPGSSRPRLSSRDRGDGAPASPRTDDLILVVGSSEAASSQKANQPRNKYVVSDKLTDSQCEEFYNPSLDSSLEKLIREAGPVEHSHRTRFAHFIPSNEHEEIVQTETISPHLSPGASLLQMSSSSTMPDAADVEESPSKKRNLTAEEHNSIILKDPHVWKSTVVNPEFLQQYYKESRLHHLSAWKADLKAEMQAIADALTVTQKLRVRRPVGSRRYILHVDFDCFFAAISSKKHPELKDKPVVVAHGKGTGSEIASCNYAARAYGVKNGMWMRKALDLCPTLIVLGYDFAEYEEASRTFYRTIVETGCTVQSVSVDEALVDISMLCFAEAGSDGVERAEGTVHREQIAADEIAEKIRKDIREGTGCEVSVGIGGNILLAKLALRKAKPAGQHQIKPEQIIDFLAPLSVQDLPGFAGSITGKLEELGIKSVQDVRKRSKEKLRSSLGPKTGEKLWDYARGIDRKEVGHVEMRKSVSAEVNWGVRFENQDQVNDFITSLCAELHNRLAKQAVKGRQLTLKIMKRAADAPLEPPKHLGHGKCDSFSKTVHFGSATSSHDKLIHETLAMIKAFGFSPGELRGIGVQMSKLQASNKFNCGKASNSSQALFKFLRPPQPPAARPRLGSCTVSDSSHKGTQFKLWPAPVSDICNKPSDTIFDDIQDDPIQDAVTPKKVKAKTPSKVPFGIDHLNQTTPSRKPLNTLGTQFVLPTQVDVQVLKELPSDIRTKLIAAGAKARAGRASPPSQQSIKSVLEQSCLNTTSPQLVAVAAETGVEAKADRPRAMKYEFPAILTALPNQSQIDQETFQALPVDVQEEIRAFYKMAPATAQIQDAVCQSNPPPKPSKVSVPPVVASVLAIPANIGRAIKPGGVMTLKQSNFITGHFRKTAVAATSGPSVADLAGAATSKSKPGRSRGKGLKTKIYELPKAQTVHPDLIGIDPDYLVALPADLQKNVILGNRMSRLRRENQQREHVQKEQERKRAHRPKEHLHLPERPTKPTFSDARISSLPKLRDAISDWTRASRTEGPHPDDVAALGHYLVRVIEEERDMRKSVQILQWLTWLVDDELVLEDDAKAEWIEAVDMVGAMLQRAVKDNGLGRLHL